MQNEKKRISFCTVVMNRKDHIIKTLRRNLEYNSDYPNLEFILLDYNSNDGLEYHIQQHFSDEILNGRLHYYKTIEPKFFNRSHSRNIAFKLATGEVICNIDADNYTNTGFASWINNFFTINSNVFLTPGLNSGNSYTKDTLGRLCLSKNHFEAVGGYDERMVNYGYEDYDIINRLEAFNIKRNGIPHNFLKAISHEEIERLTNERPLQMLHSFYIHYISPIESELLFLSLDATFKKATLVNNRYYRSLKQLSPLMQIQAGYRHRILQDNWINGTWNTSNNTVILIPDRNGRKEITFEKNDDLLIDVSTRQKYYKINNKGFIQNAIMMLTQTSNRIIMDQNRLNKLINVNSAGFGQSKVFKNFSKQAIEVL